MLNGHFYQAALRKLLKSFQRTFLTMIFVKKTSREAIKRLNHPFWQKRPWDIKFRNGTCVLLIFHPKNNFNCKRCIKAVVLIIS